MLHVTWARSSHICSATVHVLLPRCELNVQPWSPMVVLLSQKLQHWHASAPGLKALLLVQHSLKPLS